MHSLLIFSVLMSVGMSQLIPQFAGTKYIENHSQGLQNPKRNLVHVHLQSTQVFGNSTDLEYYYVDVYVGTHRQKQTLIVDTGSTLLAMPCKAYCTSDDYGKSSCGSHINEWYDIA